jgi:hypothetical protein
MGKYQGQHPPLTMSRHFNSEGQECRTDCDKGKAHREGRLSEEGKGGDTVDVFSTHV